MVGSEVYTRPAAACGPRRSSSVGRSGRRGGAGEFVDSSIRRFVDCQERSFRVFEFAVDFLRKDKTTNHTFKKKRRIMMWDDEMLQRIIILAAPS